jgi:O-antigen/teichoic acid export membrane protein
VADQVVVSGTRFTMAWVIARWRGADEFGAYVIGFSVLLVAEVVQAALVTWPMAILGPTAGRRYLADCLLIQLAVGGAAAAAVLAGGWAWPAGAGPLRGALLAAAPATFCVQMQEFWRRVSLTRGRAASAFLADALTGLVQVGLIVALLDGGRWAGGPNATRGLMATALGALCGSALGLWQNRDLVSGAATLAETLRKNWDFGRYILGSRLGEGLLSHALNFVVGAAAGLAATGALDASRLLLTPLQVAAFGLMNSLLPAAAVVLDGRGPAALDGFVRRVALRATAAFAAYAVVASAFAARWLELLYAGAYPDARLVHAWAAAHVLLGARVMLSAGLYVRRRPDVFMRAVLSSGALAVALAFPLARMGGAFGASLARLAGEAVLLGAVLLGLRRAAAARDGVPPSWPRPRRVSGRSRGRRGSM